MGTSLYKGVVEDIEFADSKKSKVAGVKVKLKRFGTQN